MAESTNGMTPQQFIDAVARLPRLDDIGWPTPSVDDDWGEPLTFEELATDWDECRG